ncbi:MAG: polyprenyl synthetase family protein [Roseiflexaceae bacterium]
MSIAAFQVNTPSVGRMQLADIMQATGLQADFVQVEHEILARIRSRQDAIQEAGLYTMQAGGKRLRVMMVLLAAKVATYDFARAVHPAVAIELLHAASLVHDDLVDHAGARRGRATVHKRWNRNVALALGDYLFGLAARELADEPDPRIIGFYVHAAQRMVEGELNPVTMVEPFDQATAQYYRKIGNKTAVLFEAACRAGIAVSGGSEQAVAALGQLGYELGLAFQIIDDVLDMTESEAVLGKPAGNDLREGTITLPLLLAAKQSDDSVLRQIIQGPIAPDQVPAVIAAIQMAGGIKAAYAAAEQCIQRGLAQLEVHASPEVFAAFQTIGETILRRRS